MEKKSDSALYSLREKWVAGDVAIEGSGGNPSGSPPISRILGIILSLQIILDGKK